MGRLEQMRAFMLVVETGRFHVAAKRLGISDAAISKLVKALEEELNVQLLHRTTRKLELTEAGQRYVNQCQRVFEELQIAENLASDLRSEPAGQLHVASGRHFADRYLIPFVKEWLALYPKIILNLQLMERIPDLETEGIDVLIGMSLSAGLEAIQKRIGSTRYVLCASPVYFEKYGKPTTVEQLAQHAYITHLMRHPNHLISFKNGQSIEVQPILFLNDARAMLECALDGIGIVKLHDYVVAEDLSAGRLVEIFSDLSEDKLPLYVAYRNQRFVPAKIRSFIDFATSNMHSD